MLKSYRNTYVIVVTTTLSAKGCLIIELVLEIVLAQVPQGCAHLSVLQLFLTSLVWLELYSFILMQYMTWSTNGKNRARGLEPPATNLVILVVPIRLINTRVKRQKMN